MRFFEFEKLLDCNSNDALERYIRYGGLPKVAKLSDETEIKDYLCPLYDSMILKIMTAEKLENPMLILAVIKCLLENTGVPLTYNSVTNEVKEIGFNSTPQTIKKIINALTRANLFNCCPRLDYFNVKCFPNVTSHSGNNFDCKQIYTFYAYDNSLFFIYGDSQQQRKQILKTIVFNEISHRYTYAIFFSKINGEIIDFNFSARILNSDVEILAEVIESVVDAKEKKKLENKFKNIPDNIHKYIFSLDDHVVNINSNFKYINIKRWLLNTKI